jgi:hypothetical protein
MGRSRSKMSFSFGSGMGGFGGGRFSVLTETWQQNISVAYMFDLFGKLKHVERAAWAQVLAAEANEQALVNSMIATVIKARIDIATIQGRLAVARANTQSRKSMLEIVEKLQSNAHVRAQEMQWNDMKIRSVEKGLEIIRGLRGHTSGYAVPSFVIDAPGGGGKIPLLPDYVVGREGDDLLLANYEGRVFRYPDPGGTAGAALEELASPASARG